MYKKKGLFITFEGVEGSGKSYQSQKLYKKLKKKNISVIKTREPGGTIGAERIRDLILKDYDIRILKDPLYILNMKDNISTNFKDKQQYYANCVKKGLVPEKPKGM